jgi:DNA modification methylase
MNIIEFGDCRETMRRWAMFGFRVQACVTSPPYFGLRDYGHSGQLGLEKSPDEYVASMVEVFRCVRDVLADDGTLWLNLGDTYARNPAKGQHKPGDSGKQGYIYDQGNGRASSTSLAGLPEKNLIGIPWRVAFALQADGWYLRQDIIWSKPNPMPESVTDRCTKAHEYIFMLTKRERYYYDHEAVKEPANPANYRERATVRQTPPGQTRQGKLDAKRGEVLCDTRNRRSVWTVATRPYKGAHFATYPPALIEPCILAASRPGDIVLDPFMGSGTTAAVAVKHGRQYLGCELNPEYEALQQERLGPSC